MKVTRKNGDPITMDLIRAKSHEDGDCLIWDGGKGAGVPYIRQPGLKNLVPVRRWIAINVLGLKTDKLMASTLCGNPSCVDPNHVAMKSRSRLIADAAARTQYHKNPVRNLKLALAARAASSMFPVIPPLKCVISPSYAMPDLHSPPCNPLISSLTLVMSKTS
jgi:hypothetical protein